MALMRTAKSCRSDAPMLASRLREEAQATVSNKPGHRGEHEVSRKTIARGMPGDFRYDRGDYARVLFYFAREAAGALGTRHSLRPLISQGERLLQNLGSTAPRECGRVSQTVIPAQRPLPLSLEVRALRCTCTAGRASKDERHGPSSFET